MLPMPAPDASGDDRENRFSNAKALLSKLIRLPELKEIFDGEESQNARKVYTQAPTLWLLVLQRLGGGLTLDAAVEELITKHSDILPENRRVVDGTLSHNNSAFSNARKKLPLSVVEEFSHRICDHLSRNSQPVIEGRRVFILDGTTITLPPTPELVAAYPPAKNAKRQSVWPVALLLVAHEMQTGCALLPQLDPMYGASGSSESSQAKRIIKRLPEDSIVLADSNFGIFSVAYHCQLHAKRFVLRLTKQRFKALKKKAELIDEGNGYRTYHLLWKPSYKDLQSTPQATKDSEIEVFIHQLELEGGKTLELVTDLEVDSGACGQLYLNRYDVEFDIRDFKVTMDTENIRAKSVDTMKKELMASVIAYNLVMQFRKQAAQLIRIEPRQLSFSGVWLTFRSRLLEKNLETFEAWLDAYQAALINASQRRLPSRPKPRSYPRLTHPRSQKLSKYQRQLSKKTKRDNKEPPD